MSKRVLIVATSLRAGSNSAILAEEFARGAREAGHTVEQVSLAGKTLGFCHGCLACQKTLRCVIRDDAAGLIEAIQKADVIAFATPIYYYEMSGQMKTLLDRCNPLFPAEYAFREIYLLATAADGSESAMDGAVKGIQGWIDCFEQARLAGVVRGTGANLPGEIRKNEAAMAEAFALGRGV